MRGLKYLSAAARYTTKFTTFTCVLCISLVYFFTNLLQIDIFLLIYFDTGCFSCNIMQTQTCVSNLDRLLKAVTV